MWVKRLDVLMFEVLYLAQPYQLKRQDLHHLKYFLYYSVLFVVYIPPAPISLFKISQINNFGFVPGKLWQKGKMEEVNKEKAANIERLDGSCTKACGSAVVPGFGEALPRLARPQSDSREEL